MPSPHAAPHRAGTLRLLAATACAAMILQGCADDALRTEPSTPDPSLAQAAPDAARPVAGPNGTYFVSIAANGTGCPHGTWDFDVARDGMSYEIVHATYEVEIESGERISFKDCNTTVKLRSATPAQFAVSAYQSRGYTYLDEGVKGFMMGSYYFQGNPVPPADRAKRVDVTGPADRHIVVDESVGDEALVWSPCRLDNNLLMPHRIGVLNGAARGTGYLNMSTLDGKYYGRLWFQLRARPCVADVSDAGDAGRAPSAAATTLDAGVP